MNLIVKKMDIELLNAQIEKFQPDLLVASHSTILKLTKDNEDIANTYNKVPIAANENLPYGVVKFYKDME